MSYILKKKTLMKSLVFAFCSKMGKLLAVTDTIYLTLYGWPLPRGNTILYCSVQVPSTEFWAKYLPSTLNDRWQVSKQTFHRRISDKSALRNILLICALAQHLSTSFCIFSCPVYLHDTNLVHESLFRPSQIPCWPRQGQALAWAAVPWKPSATRTEYAYAPCFHGLVHTGARHGTKVN